MLITLFIVKVMLRPEIWGKKETETYLHALLQGGVVPLDRPFEFWVMERRDLSLLAWNECIIHYLIWQQDRTTIMIVLHKQPISLKLWMMLGFSLHLWFLKTRDYIKLGSNYYIKLGSNYYIKHSMQTWFKRLHQTRFEIFYINSQGRPWAMAKSATA